MNTRSVLIVDDEKNIRLTLRQALEATDMETAVAINGEEALRLLAERTFDLVLLDLRLPGMPGSEVLRRLHQSHPDLPVVIITAYGTVDSAVEAMRDGAVHFLQKPFAPEEIREIVAAVLERRHPGRDLSAEYNACVAQARQAIEDHLFAVAHERAKKALALIPSRPEAFNLLGTVLEKQGKWLEAQKHYRAALALDSTYEPAQKNLFRVTSWNKTGAVDLGGNREKKENR